MKKRVVVIGGTGNHELDKHILKVVNDLWGSEDLEFTRINMDLFADGEEDFRIANYELIQGRHVLLFQSIHSNNLMIQFLQLAWASKFQYQAASVTAVVPFLRYRRQDHPENMEEINRNKWIAAMMAASGVDRIILCDVHSEETLNNMRSFKIEAYNVSAAPAFAAKLRAYVDTAHEKGKEFLVYAPDKGSVLRAIELGRELKCRVIINLKKRQHDGEATIEQDDAQMLATLSEQHNYPLEFATSEIVQGNYVCIRDDELSTGGTACTTGRRLKNLGAAWLCCCMTHAICAPGWKRKFFDSNPFDIIFFGNTVPRGYEKSTGGFITDIHASQVIGNKVWGVLQGLL